jgi:stalled ribosome alternative rescue factor ArfA
MVTALPALEKGQERKRKKRKGKGQERRKAKGKEPNEQQGYKVFVV